MRESFESDNECYNAQYDLQNDGPVNKLDILHLSNRLNTWPYPDMTDTLVRDWESRSDEDRQRVIRNLFQYLVWDFDQKQIVDFKSKPCAENSGL